MTGWDRIKLTEARQVTALIGHDPDDWPAASVTVRDHYADLRAGGRSGQALDYIGHALPRADALAWAGRLLDDESRRIELARPARFALDTALRWIGEPGEAHRRAAYAAAQAMRRPAPEKFLAMAVFYSGGSIAAPGSPDIPPPEGTCASYLVGAVRQAGYRSAAPATFVAAALDLGEAVAERGSAALAR